jgi:hypothetical protein
MSIASCPSCGHQANVKAGLDGRRLKCPSCQKPFTVSIEGPLEVEPELPVADLADHAEPEHPSHRRSGAKRGRSRPDEDEDEVLPKQKPAKAGAVIALCAGVGLVVVVAGCLGVGLLLKKGRDSRAAQGSTSDPPGHVPEWKKMQAEQERERQAEQARMRKIHEDSIAGKGNGKGKTAGTDKVKSNRNLPREEFRNLVVGLTGEELIEAIGRPDSTQSIDGQDFWYYHNVALDPATGKPYALVQIIGGSGGRAKEVNFH